MRQKTPPPGASAWRKAFIGLVGSVCQGIARRLCAESTTPALTFP
jgi:hypothetical protein